MPSKTDRILSYLPFTFLAARRQSALRALAGAVGNELQNGEATLARIMRSHWVDSADEGAALIDDLERIASMYGLAPLRDLTGEQLETVEQFRRRLKRYVRTLLEGRVTVPGLINVAAEILDVTIPEADALDVWWKRHQRETVTLEPRGEDAAVLVFGQPFVDIHGIDAQPAVVRGTVDLSQGANLENASVIRLRIDGGPPATIELAPTGIDKGSVSLKDISAAINASLPGTASQDGRFLTLRSQVVGPDAKVELLDTDGDATFAILGVPSHVYTGIDARSAQVTSTVSLAGGVDLTRERFLRVVVNNTQRAEIDCASSDNPATTTLNVIRDAINQALSVEVASHKDGLLSLSTPEKGSANSIFLQSPAAQNCTQTLFGQQPAFFLGIDPRPAFAVGIRDLGATVDLSQRSLVKVEIDGGEPTTINCAGAKPAETTVDEIVAKLNAALGEGRASVSQGRAILSSSNTGQTGQIVFHPAGEGDALGEIFGFGPRVFTGTPAVRASFTGASFPKAADLPPPGTPAVETAVSKETAPPAKDEVGVDLFASHRLGVQLNQNLPLEIDLPRGRNVTPQEIADAIEAALGSPNVEAFATESAVGITSRTAGSKSRIAIVPLERELRRRFVTRAAIQDEAARIVLGFSERLARGRESTSARVDSKIDLRFGADLRTDRWLSISIDGGEPVTLDCSGPRPRTTALEEVVEILRNGRGGVPGLGADHVKLEKGVLSLASTTTGSGSRVFFHPVTIQDARKQLKLASGEIRGQEAERVVFTSTIDLAKGVELAADARIKIGVDAVNPVEVLLNTTTAPARKTLNEIVTAINSVVAATVASHDGRFLILASRARGDDSKLVFETPTGTDVTKALFGFTAPRSYQADKATSATSSSLEDLPATLNLRESRFLRIAVDGRAPFVIDCVPKGELDLTKIDSKRVAVAISDQLSLEPKLPSGAAVAVAKIQGNRMVISSTTLGAASRIALEAHVAGDAKSKLFGDVPDQTHGKDPVPAEIVGEVSLSKGVDLSQSRKLLLCVNSGRPVEVDIAGEAPSETTLHEIVASINKVLPGLASSTPEGFLRLRTVSAGSGSTLEVLPRRYIELVEYPLLDQHFDAGVVKHGSPVTVHNSGVEGSLARVEVTSLNGTVDPTLVSHFGGGKFGLKRVLRPGEKLVFEQDGDANIHATIESPVGSKIVVPGSSLEIEPPNPQPSGAGLELPRGDSEWTFFECLGPRFDEAHFNQARFPGLPPPPDTAICETVGMFDLSHLDGHGGPDQSIFAPHPLPDSSATLTFRWRVFQGGAFELNLPAELRPVFGGRFNQARFGLGTVEEDGIRKPRLAVFSGLVFDPPDVPEYIVKALEAAEPKDFVVTASDLLNNVPLGFAPNLIPFRTPRFLTRGDEKEPAKIYLLDPDSGNLIELAALEPGDFGNQISVAMRPDGPGKYLLEVKFPGDRFESARSLVLGPPEGAETTAAPGVLRAKAAGVSARVTRSRAGDSN